MKVYQEEESASRAGHRRKLARLVADAGRRRSRVVPVLALDRLSREGSAAILGIVSKLSRHNVKALSYQESQKDCDAAPDLVELRYTKNRPPGGTTGRIAQN